MPTKLPITVSSSENRTEYLRQYRIVRKEKILEYNSSTLRLKANVMRIRNKKLFLAETAGGKCKVCGLKASISNIECFDFHHIGPKEFTMGPFTISMKRLLKELKQCILVCSNCHRTIHRQIDDDRLEIN